MDEIDKETRQAYVEYWQLRGTKDYLHEVMFLLGMLVPLVVLAVLISKTLDVVSDERAHHALKLCVCIGGQCFLVCAVVVHWRHRATCEQTSNFKFDWPLRFERNSDYDACAGVGIGLWALCCVIKTCVDFVAACTNIYNVVDTIAASIWDLLEGMACAEEEIGTMVKRHTLFIVLPIAFCILVMIPNVMCWFQSFSRMTTVVFDIVYFSALCTTMALFIVVLVVAFAFFLDCCGIPILERWNKWCNESRAAAWVAGTTRCMMSMHGTTLQQATQANIDAITTTIATKKYNAPTFEEANPNPAKGKRKKHVVSLKNHFYMWCEVNNKQPTDQDILDVLTKNNIADTTKARSLYIKKELIHLKLLDP
jgi:hypothetical protein